MVTALLSCSALAAPLTLAFAGDVSLARGVTEANARQWPQTFAPLSGALRAHATFANLESPLTTAPGRTAGVDLRASPAAAAALHPFTHVSVENNHAQDGGEPGRRQLIGVLSRARVQPVRRTPVSSTLGGQRVAWLAYLDDGRTPLPLADVRRARQLVGPGGLVIVTPHWGDEYRSVTARQKQQARQLVGAGADLIVGSGPHVLQGTERLGNALVLYSLGNLIFDQPYPATWPGAVVRVTRLHPAAPLSACAVPTFSRAGRVRTAHPEEARLVLDRLNLPAC